MILGRGVIRPDLFSKGYFSCCGENRLEECRDGESGNKEINISIIQKLDRLLDCVCIFVCKRLERKH